MPLDFCRLLGLGCPKQAFAKIAALSELDLSPLYAGIKAIEGGSGRPPIDPVILMTLWLYATFERVGSAREPARLTEQDDADR